MKCEIKNLHHKLVQSEKLYKQELEQLQVAMTNTITQTLREKLVLHLDKFKAESKFLRFQLNSFKREFSAKDMAFMKLRNAASGAEFTIVQLKRYLQEQNLRMVYRLMSLPLPKNIRTKLLNDGCDMSDYFPMLPNMRPGPMCVSGLLGLIEFRHHATDE